MATATHMEYDPSVFAKTHASASVQMRMCGAGRVGEKRADALKDLLFAERTGEGRWERPAYDS